MRRRPRAAVTRAFRGAALIAWLGGFAASLAACGNGVGGFSGSVGNTPPTTPQTLYNVLGTVGTPFSLLISDTQQSWSVVGNVPLNIAIENGNPPVRMIATKTANNGNLLSLQVTQGFTVQALASTGAPFGTVSIGTKNSPDNNIAPAAFPDLRIAVNGPAGERYQGLVEDSETGFQVSTRAPTVFLFEHPNGKVDGNFMQQQNLGSFEVVMTLNGVLVATAEGGPNLIIREP